jgi:hypothetical protein
VLLDVVIICINVIIDSPKTVMLYFVLFYIIMSVIPANVHVILELELTAVRDVHICTEVAKWNLCTHSRELSYASECGQPLSILVVVFRDCSFG